MFTQVNLSMNFYLLIEVDKMNNFINSIQFNLFLTMHNVLKKLYRNLETYDKKKQVYN